MKKQELMSLLEHMINTYSKESYFFASDPVKFKFDRGVAATAGTILTLLSKKPKDADYYARRIRDTLFRMDQDNKYREESGQ